MQELNFYKKYFLASISQVSKLKMKKQIKYLLIIILINSCVTVNDKMRTALSDIYPGMTISEFKNKVPKASLLQLIDNFVCYKLEISPKPGNLTVGPNGYDSAIRFFYFKDGKLYRIDEGERSTDLKIEIEHSQKNK